MVDIPSPGNGAVPWFGPQHANLIVKNTVYAVEEPPWAQVTRRTQSLSPQRGNLNGKLPLRSDPEVIMVDAPRDPEVTWRTESPSPPMYPDTDDEETAYVPQQHDPSLEKFLHWPPGDWRPVAAAPATSQSAPATPVTVQCTAACHGEKAEPKAKQKASRTKCETKDRTRAKPRAKAEQAACRPTGTFPMAGTLHSNVEALYAEELRWSVVKEMVAKEHGPEEVEKHRGSVKVRGGFVYEVTLAKRTKRCAVVFVPCADSDAAGVAKELIAGTTAKDVEGSGEWWLKNFQRKDGKLCIRGRGTAGDKDRDKDTFTEDRREQRPLVMLVFGSDTKLAEAVPKVVQRVQTVCEGLKAAHSNTNTTRPPAGPTVPRLPQTQLW